MGDHRRSKRVRVRGGLEAQWRTQRECKESRICKELASRGNPMQGGEGAFRGEGRGWERLVRLYLVGGLRKGMKIVEVSQVVVWE